MGREQCAHRPIVPDGYVREMPKRSGRVPVPRSVEHALDRALDRALSIQRPVVVAYVARVRRRKPDAAPAELVVSLERRYLAAVVGTGAASGGAAALPGRRDGRVAGNRRRGDRRVRVDDGDVRAGSGRGLRHPCRRPASAPCAGAHRPARRRRRGGPGRRRDRSQTLGAGTRDAPARRTPQRRSTVG